MKTDPSLFTFTNDTLEITVDLAKIALMAKRESGAYWLRTIGGESVQLAPEAGVAIRGAWIAYQGKFDPAKDR